jgi:hypothetical protein
MKLAEADGPRTRYVRKVKGDGGVDWEWTYEPAQATDVSQWWAARFLAEGRHMGRTRWTSC